MNTYNEDKMYESYSNEVERMQKCIDELQQENKKLNGAIQTYDILLKSNAEENKQLKEKLDKYENPKDMTLMMMWCTEKVKDENKELKKKYENAVADYEKTEFEKEQLNSLVNSCQEEIRRLKKQVEQYQEEVCILDMRTDENIKLINQQKEFIKYLEDEINKWNYNYDSYNYEYEVEEPTAEELANKILQKYKSIIGDDK